MGESDAIKELRGNYKRRAIRGNRQLSLLMNVLHGQPDAHLPTEEEET